MADDTHSKKAGVMKQISATRHHNRGLRKICGCQRRAWAKCLHPWHFNFKAKGGASYRFSVDSEAGKHIGSKTVAEGLADTWRTQIREGTFRRRSETVADAVVPTPDTITLRDFGPIYYSRRGTPATANDTSRQSRLCAFTPEGQRPLGETPLAAITQDQLEEFLAQLRKEGLAASTRNHYVQHMKALFRWALKKGYLSRDPAIDSESIRRSKHAKRNRRLTPDLLDDRGNVTLEGEERRLLGAAGAHLRRLIVAALETGCRRGELLALRWADADLPGRKLTVRAETAKTRTGRVLPISARLAGELEMARTALEVFHSTTDVAKLPAQAQEALLARCHVFGDVTGAKVGDIKRAWETAILRAHGHTPAWTHTNQLTPALREARRIIDLHFHDLRHEAGSRWVEAGLPLHHVQEMLGHANIAQTSTYLNATGAGLQESMRRFDEAAARCNPVAIDATFAPQPLRNEESGDAAKPLVN